MLRTYVYERTCVLLKYDPRLIYPLCYDPRLITQRKVFMSQCSILCSKYKCIWLARIANQTPHYLCECVIILFGDAFTGLTGTGVQLRKLTDLRLKPYGPMIYISLTITMNGLLTLCRIKSKTPASSLYPTFYLWVYEIDIYEISFLYFLLLDTWLEFCSNHSIF